MVLSEVSSAEVSVKKFARWGDNGSEMKRA